MNVKKALVIGLYFLIVFLKKIIIKKVLVTYVILDNFITLILLILQNINTMRNKILLVWYLNFL